MIIHLTKEELDYLHEAINVWHAEASDYIKKLKKFKNPSPYYSYSLPTCIEYTEMEINNVKSLTTSMDADWKNNKGEINLEHYSELFFKYSAHNNKRETPLFLSIKAKVLDARRRINAESQVNSICPVSKKEKSDLNEKKIDCSNNISCEPSSSSSKTKRRINEGLQANSIYQVSKKPRSDHKKKNKKTDCSNNVSCGPSSSS